MRGVESPQTGWTGGGGGVWVTSVGTSPERLAASLWGLDFVRGQAFGAGVFLTDVCQHGPLCLRDDVCASSQRYLT